MSDILRFLALYKPYRGQVLSGVILSSITLMVGVALLGVSGWFITAMGLAGVAGLTINYFAPAAIIRALAILRTAGRYAERMVNHDAALKVTAEFRQWFYARLEPLAPAGLQDLSSGDVFSRLRGDIDILERFYLQGAVAFCTGIVALIVFGIVFACYSPFLAVLQIGLLLMTGLILPLLLERSAIRDHADLNEIMRSTRIDLAASMQAMGEYLVYGGAARALSGFAQQSRDLLAMQERFNKRDALMQALLVFIMGLSMTGGMIMILPLVRGGRLDPAHAGALPLLCLACFDAAIILPPAIKSLYAARSAAGRVFALASRPVPRIGTQMLPAGPFHLSVRNLVFSYGDNIAVNDVSFDLSAGQALNLTGPSGSGKTTILNLLAGFWQPEQGMVFLKGQDITACAPDDIRGCFAFAPQKPYLFADTIAANLRIASPGATTAMMDEACSAAGLLEFIETLPEGYATYVGENGLRFSGGQIRRLSLARALLRNAPCLVLDEPGEGLDAVCESLVLQSVLRLARQRHQAVLLARHKDDLSALLIDSLMLK